MPVSQRPPTQPGPPQGTLLLCLPAENPLVVPVWGLLITSPTQTLLGLPRFSPQSLSTLAFTPNLFLLLFSMSSPPILCHHNTGGSCAPRGNNPTQAPSSGSPDLVPPCPPSSHTHLHPISEQSPSKSLSLSLLCSKTLYGSLVPLGQSSDSLT